MREHTVKAALAAVRTSGAAIGPAVALAVAGAVLAGSVGYLHAGVMPGSDMPALGLGVAAIARLTGR
jgi:hypothetical protein